MSWEMDELKKLYFAMRKKIHAAEIQEWKEKNRDKIKEISINIPPADIADMLTLQSNVILQARFFRLLQKEKAAQVFSLLEKYNQNKLLAHFSPKEIKDLLSFMDPDDRADLFEELPSIATRKLLNLLDKESADEVKKLLGYPEDSVGRLMNPDYIAIRLNWTIFQTLEHVRKWGKKSETSDVVYVTDKDWKLLGVVSLRNLVINPPNITIDKIMKQPAVFVQVLEDQEVAHRTMQKYDLSVLPVVDSFGVLVGIVTADDVFDVVEEETTEDFQKSSAVEVFRENFLHSNILFLFKKRISWLVMLAFVNLIAGAIILSFEDMLSRAIVLVSFMPFLIGSAGNSGSQSATLTIRAMAVGDVKKSDWLRIIGREVLIAFLLGIVMGLIAGALGLFRADLMIALVVGLTMVAVVLLGSLVGVSLPFILNKFKIDPAVASSPLVASIADVFGVLIYLVVAKMLLF